MITRGNYFANPLLKLRSERAKFVKTIDPVLFYVVTEQGSQRSGLNLYT